MKLTKVAAGSLQAYQCSSMKLTNVCSGKLTSETGVSLPMSQQEAYQCNRRKLTSAAAGSLPAPV